MEKRTFTEPVRVTFRKKLGFIIGYRQRSLHNHNLEYLFKADEESVNFHQARANHTRNFDGSPLITNGTNRYWFIKDEHWSDLELVPQEKPSIGRHQPVKGEKVLVRNDPDGDWKERYFISDLGCSMLPYVVVASLYNEAYRSGGDFGTTSYKFMKPMPKKGNINLDSDELKLIEIALDMCDGDDFDLLKEKFEAMKKRMKR